jgi:CTP:molybdopterin cytidylyltransferase MocA
MQTGEVGMLLWRRRPQRRSWQDQANRPAVALDIDTPEALAAIGGSLPSN